MATKKSKARRGNKNNADRDYGVAIDTNKVEWKFRLGFNTMRKVLRELDISLAQLTVMEVKFADLMDCLHIICAAQIKELNIGKEEFYERMDTIGLPELTEALKVCVASAFPSMKEQLEGSDGGTSGKSSPLGLGK